MTERCQPLGNERAVVKQPRGFEKGRDVDRNQTHLLARAGQRSQPCLPMYRVEVQLTGRDADDPHLCRDPGRR